VTAPCAECSLCIAHYSITATYNGLQRQVATITCCSKVDCWMIDWCSLQSGETAYFHCKYCLLPTSVLDVPWRRRFRKSI